MVERLQTLQLPNHVLRNWVGYPPSGWKLRRPDLLFGVVPLLGDVESSPWQWLNRQPPATIHSTYGPILTVLLPQSSSNLVKTSYMRPYNNWLIAILIVMMTLLLIRQCHCVKTLQDAVHAEKRDFWVGEEEVSVRKLMDPAAIVHNIVVIFTQ